VTAPGSKAGRPALSPSFAYRPSDRAIFPFDRPLQDRRRNARASITRAGIRGQKGSQWFADLSNSGTCRLRSFVLPTICSYPTWGGPYGTARSRPFAASVNMRSLLRLLYALCDWLLGGHVYPAVHALGASAAEGRMANSWPYVDPAVRLPLSAPLPLAEGLCGPRRRALADDTDVS
jgi:hypothetical protein